MSSHIPEGWEESPLEEIAHINMGQSPDSKECNENFIGLPFLQGNADFGSKYPVAISFCESPKKKANVGDILISVRAPVGDMNLADREYCIGRGLAAIRPKKKIELNFLFYSLLIERIQLYRLMQGTTFEAVNRQDLARTEIKYPCSPEEQQKIASILMTIDNNIESTKALIEKHRKMMQGLMQDLFSPNAIPKDWICLRLRDACKNAINGGTPSTENPRYWKGTIPWITGADILEQKVAVIRRYINDEAIRNSSTNVIPKGNLLIVTRTGVGKIAIAPFDIAISQDFTGFIPNEKTIVEFLYYLLDYCQSYFINLTQGTSINGITRDDLLDFDFICPISKKEQQKIVDILATNENIIRNEKEYLSKLCKIKSGLMQDLLSGNKRVKVGG